MDADNLGDFEIDHNSKEDVARSDHFNIHRMEESKLTDPIDKLYKVISNCGKDKLQETCNLGMDLLENHITDEMIQHNSKQAQHPIFHEIAEQYIFSHILFQKVAEHPRFIKYMNSELYLDQYGKTVLQRLVRANSDLPYRKDQDWSEHIIWIEKQFKIIFPLRK